MKKGFLFIFVFLMALGDLAGCARQEPPEATPLTPAVTVGSTPAPTASPTPAASPSPEVSAAPQTSAAPEYRFSPPAKLAEGEKSVLIVYDADKDVRREMTLEDYLCAVVAGEMAGDFPPEALRAQAVVARTFLVNFLTEKGRSALDPQADISTDVEESQAFEEAAVTDAVREAVRSTAGRILTYEGEAIHAWFHAASGGMTATAREGLGYTRTATPYIVPVESDESGAPEEVRRWSASFSRAEVEAAVTAVLGYTPKFDTVKAGEKGPSGRVMTVDFSGVAVSAPALRLTLGSTKMRSTLLDSLIWKDDTLTLSGRGYGHGVGLSQWGARAMAEAGEDAETILAHYYPGADWLLAWGN